MPRELSDKTCEVTFYDRISDSQITLLYRMPSTEERVKYSNALVTRRLNKIESSIGEARIKGGANILLGFREGAFSMPGKGVISSDPGAANYDPDWKANVRKYASDVLEMLAAHVFESALSAGEASAESGDKEATADPS